MISNEMISQPCYFGQVTFFKVRSGSGSAPVMQSRVMHLCVLATNIGLSCSLLHAQTIRVVYLSRPWMVGISLEAAEQNCDCDCSGFTAQIDSYQQLLTMSHRAGSVSHVLTNVKSFVGCVLAIAAILVAGWQTWPFEGINCR